jgi:AcrR family transcriptional regulator
MTVDDVCSHARLSKGAFYGYFDQKQALLLALLEDDATHLDQILDELERTEPSNVRKLRNYARAVLEWSEGPGRAQLRADLWTALFSVGKIREAFTVSVQRRRERVRGWVEAGIRTGEIAEVPANALASIVLALSDGLMLHASVQPSAFRWANVRRALDMLLTGLERRGTAAMSSSSAS